MKTIEVKKDSAIVELSTDELKWLSFLTDASLCVSGDKMKNDFTFGSIDSLIESAIHNQNKINRLKKENNESELNYHDSVVLGTDIEYLIKIIKNMEV